VNYDILTYGRQELRAKSVPVDTIDESVKELAADMLRTMKENNGLGLAAAQVGRPEAMCVIDVSPVECEPTDEEEEGGVRIPMPLIMINPEIVESEGKMVGTEGCLSFPEIFASVERAAEVTVDFIDLDSTKQTVHADGLLARAIQHEVDHLSGVLLVDRMSFVQKTAMAGRLKRMAKESLASAGD
jgi:peptide deformylase